ncbi:MAG: OmpA family protein [Candidatus Stahlbacteria bacterium]|nr:MAG: OmpA family protein [Candidatus Stahlbacteria bacterium]
MYDGIKGISSSALYFAMKVPAVALAAAAIIATTAVVKDKKEVIEELKPKTEISETVKAPAIPVFKVVALDGIILFDFDKFNIDAVAKEILDKIAVQMCTTHPNKLLILEGHTDKFGSNKYNQVLSENRASSAKAYLIKLGVPADRIISVKGFGKTLLLPKMTHHQNRRVILLFVDK